MSDIALERTTRNSQPKRIQWIYIQIFWVCIMYWLRSVLHFPGVITYLTDIITILLLLFSGNTIKNGLTTSKITVQKYIFTAIAIFMALGIVINGVSPLLALWGIRNNVRFFAFFFICIGLLETNNIDAVLEFFKKFFWVHAILCFHQYFVLGYSHDYLGGIFGIDQGCNTYHNIYLCIITSIVIAEYCYSKMSIQMTGIYLAFCMYFAYLAELKVFYAEFLMIAAIVILATRPSLKTVGFCFLGVVILLLVINLINQYDPELLEFFLDTDARDTYLSGNGYTNAGDLNRFTAVQQLYQMFFKGNPSYALLGFGLGSCDTSSYSFLQSEFFKRYEYLHYRWFSHAWIYLEQGATGLILMILFIASVAVYALFMRKNERKDLVLITLAYSSTTLLGILYNCALEMDVCYIIAFMLSIPFILSKSAKDEDTVSQNVSPFRRNIYRRAKHELPKRRRFGEESGSHSA